MVELFLSFEISCEKCGSNCIYRDRCKNKIEFPNVICNICKCRITPMELFGLRLLDASIKCYTFDCDKCGEFNMIEEIKESAFCGSCYENNFFE